MFFVRLVSILEMMLPQTLEDLVSFIFFDVFIIHYIRILLNAIDWAPSLLSAAAGRMVISQKLVGQI